MISSLTGFGRYIFTDEVGRIGVELKSVNNRFLHIDLHLPYGFNWADGKIRRYLSSSISRGKVYLHLEVVDYNPNQEVILNRPLLSKLVKLREEISSETGYDLPINFDGLLSLPGTMKIDSRNTDNEMLWSRIEPVLKQAVNEFIESRHREGKNLAEDLRQRSHNLAVSVDKISERLPEFKEDFIKRFSERISELADKAEIDEARLNTEIAIWADKSDVSEELTRLHSHLKELEKTLQAQEPVGRRLDFLVQELNREANTLTSKISDVSISQHVIDIKCEIEKIREQAQNIE